MKLIKFGAVVVLLSGISLGGGCSSGGRASESQKAVSTIAEMSSQLNSAKGDVERAIQALDNLSAGRDLEKSFKTYHSAVASLENSGEKAQARWKSMQAKGNEYMKKWESEVGRTSNPEVRAGMETRSEKVRANYQKVQNAAKSVADSYRPFLKDLQEIDKALSLDLSPAGVQSLQPAFGNAKMSGRALSQSIDGLKAELDGIRAGMSPQPSR
jgi:hypothetical protein